MFEGVQQAQDATTPVDTIAASHLIVVPGHAAFNASVQELPPNFYVDDPWVLQAFQQGEPPAYIKHVQDGIDLLAQQREDSILIFSGGLTRPETRWTEAVTYYRIAEQFINQRPDGKKFLSRVAIENFARDSFENVAFSYERFEQLAGHYPKSMVVVGWGFKEERFRMHAKELNIHDFTYWRSNDPEDKAVREAAEAGERKTREDYSRYPRGEGGKPNRIRRERSLSSDPIPYAKYQLELARA